jgi:malate dehydrogenase (oxaloacetate-decarboxylating)(NADP+)
LAEIAIGAARHVRRFGLVPKIALCSQSQFGNQPEGSGQRLRDAIAILDSAPRDFLYEGEMNVDAALDPDLRERLLPGNRLQGVANVLIFGHADAASGVRNILKMRASGLEVGPILMGMGNRAHVVSPGITARGLLNMAAIAGTPVAHYG